MISTSLRSCRVKHLITLVTRVRHFAALATRLFIMPVGTFSLLVSRVSSYAAAIGGNVQILYLHLSFKPWVTTSTTFHLFLHHFLYIFEFSRILGENLSSPYRIPDFLCVSFLVRYALLPQQRFFKAFLVLLTRSNSISACMHLPNNVKFTSMDIMTFSGIFVNWNSRLSPYLNPPLSFIQAFTQYSAINLDHTLCFIGPS